ncbi:hypothetical protein [Candidatus Hakubella thermalkaliphila]|uniref:hypothetical protein n=1 Tax=Candidatus Hakubella thermalkaliphila TaxID=2754717 RepID=UPI001593CAE3|nr:hypothetical protein [Candidatus Hakubella thermalkaliphila]
MVELFRSGSSIALSPDSLAWIKESPMRRGAPRRMKIGLFSRETKADNPSASPARP